MKKKAEIGYMSIGIYPPPEGAFWGEFNNRMIQEEWIEGMTVGFEKHIDNCADGCAMDMAVRREWIDNIEVVRRTVEGSRIHLVPEVSFTEEGKKAIIPENLWMLSGNHRRETLTRYLDKLTDDIEKIEMKIKKIKGSKDVVDLDKEKKRDVDGAKAAIAKKQEIISKSTKWVVRLYDRGV